MTGEMPYLVTVVGEGPEQLVVGRMIPLPFLPLPGMLLVINGKVWETASQPQVTVGEFPGSRRPLAPMLVNVRVRPGRGLFAGD